MSKWCFPNAVRAENYVKVLRIGSKSGKKPFRVHGSGFFTEVNPHLLVTAAHVDSELVRLGVLRIDWHKVNRQAALLGINEKEDAAIKVWLDHGSTIELGKSRVHIDVAGCWARGGRHSVIRNTDPNPPFKRFVLPVNSGDLDFGVCYFRPVVRDGRVYEFRGKVVQDDHFGSYQFQAEGWPGDSGSPLFDEEGRVVGVIYGGIYDFLSDRSKGWRDTLFTPFSLLRSLGLLDALLCF